jgi:hypothetical protein
VTGGTNGGSGNLVITITHIRLINKTSGSGTVTLYKGATGANTAGTELCLAKVVPANDFVDLYFPNPIVFTTADFLVGGANAVTTITLMAFGEIGLAQP